jgi:glycosyltransferase involved in cell wall biosynthesis
MSIGIMHLVDTLEIGGLERIAVNLANHAARVGYRSFLCATRSCGALADAISDEVRVIVLGRRHRFDLGPLLRLRRFLSQYRIQILHMHGSALFAGRVAAIGLPGTALVWHAHYGRLAERNAPLPWRTAIRGVSAVVTVSKPLADWSEHHLGVEAERIHCIPNFVVSSGPVETIPLDGVAGYRCVCVANDRLEKGLDILVEAFRSVRAEVPEARLFWVGRPGITTMGEAGIVALGERNDVPSVLASCDVGILSSRVEGLPMALLEYGAAGLGAICTRVGQCEEVALDGQAALLVNPSNPQELAHAIIGLLRSPERRIALGCALRARVAVNYSVDTAWRSLQPIYERLVFRGTVTA